MLGVRQGFLEVYHSEMVLSRESQKHLREDAFHMKTLSQVKNGLKQELAQLRWELTNFKADRWSSPHTEIIHIQTKIESVEEELRKSTLLTVAPTGDLPRGLVCRLALRLEGGTAANHASLVVCTYPTCSQTLRLAALMSEHASSG